MRTNQNLTAEQLKLLWASDPDAALVEWSYRMFDTPAVLESPDDFIDYLTKEYAGQIRGPLKGKNVLGIAKLTELTTHFSRGNITLQEWAERVRWLITGAITEKTRIFVIKDPEVESHRRRVRSELQKK